MKKFFQYALVFRFIPFFICMYFLIGVVDAQEEEPNWDKWTPELQMRFKNITDTDMSPDDKYVAYVVREAVMEEEKSEFVSQIWVVATDGSFNVQYTRGEKSATRPSFSPDNQYLAFTSSRDGEKDQIWIMRVHGGEAEKITDAKSGITAFEWSPDGKYIAYLMTDPETEEEEKAKKEKRDVILVDQNFKYSHLYKISVIKNDRNERETKRLTAGEFHITSFDWSPDGKNIVFAHKSTPSANMEWLEQDISVVPADSGEVTPLVVRTGYDSNPLYSPDGKWVAFVSSGGSLEWMFLGDVYIISSDGSESKKLADTHDRAASLIEWAADSKHLFFTEDKGTSLNIFSLSIDGKPAKMITSGSGNFSSAALNKKTDLMSFVYETTDDPMEVYASAVSNFNMKRLSAANMDVPKPLMGKTELITWNSIDGKQIEGLLTYPVGYKEGRQYPLILNVHGGPPMVYSQSFTGMAYDYMIQTFAQNGYAIIRPNPRGSTGYGKDFRYANFRDWGYGDYEDLMAGVDKVIEMGIGHVDSLCIMGRSYGGYMTAFAVTRTNRFKAASVGAGISNLISFQTTTDIPDFMVAYMGGEFWDDYETFEKHSVMYRIENITTPTQIYHGAEDVKVPLTQGQELYVALKRLGVPTEMVVYPRTPHSPTGQPKFLMDITPRILAWFDYHLGRVKESAEFAVE
ncbi:S9 family peptidase [bacterium]|nr:S9 family peptidase [bacterium]